VGKPFFAFSTAPSLSTTLSPAEFSFTLLAKLADLKKKSAPGVRLGHGPGSTTRPIKELSKWQQIRKKA
jgi:hypothetical protein